MMTDKIEILPPITITAWHIAAGALVYMLIVSIIATAFAMGGL